MMIFTKAKTAVILLKEKVKERGGRHWKKRPIFCGNITLTIGK
ncbi:hypothetical protein ACQCVK_12630 [Rossellomorea vietnamensis]|nr:hypothetical protein [Rossellomorea aquimaris]